MLYLDIKQTPSMGRGVYAAKKFKSGEILEVCPAIPIPDADAKLVQQTIVEYWFYEWKTWEESAMVLGYGMIYNHSVDPNAKYTLDFSNNTVIIEAIKDISEGEQIFINYHQDLQSSELEMIDANSGKIIKYNSD